MYADGRVVDIFEGNHVAIDAGSSQSNVCKCLNRDLLIRINVDRSSDVRVEQCDDATDAIVNVEEAPGTRSFPQTSNVDSGSEYLIANAFRANAAGTFS